jgi:hypothetical protein
MRTFILLLLSLLAGYGNVCLAQTGNDTIQVKKTGDGTRFLHEEMKIARSSHTMGSILGFTGGFLAGYQLGTLIRGGQPNWLVAGVGVGLIGLSLPLSSGYTRHAKKAVAIYNSGLQAANRPKVDVRAGFALNHIRLGVTF